MTNSPLPTGSTIGILGGGQLGRMLSLAAARLGFRCHIYCPEVRAPASVVAGDTTCANYLDEGALAYFARSCNVVTFEFENIPAQSLEIIGKITDVAPGIKSLLETQDRLVEKNMLNRLDIPVAPFAVVDDAASLAKAVQEIGRPSILKTRRMGYDGKGQVRIDEGTDLNEAFEALKGAPAILEGFISFEKEFSVVMTRGADGEKVFYDISENDHENHILKETRVPSSIPAAIGDQAIEMAGKIADELEHVGTLAVECFYCGADAESAVLVNEIAPRVHNSGHWTIDACLVSQFENHMRAVAGWPLGATERHSDAVMTNLIGEDAADCLGLAGQGEALHLYGKSEIRDGRKMGHSTRISPKT